MFFFYSLLCKRTFTNVTCRATVRPEGGPVRVCQSFTHIFCVHDVAALANRRDGLVGVDSQGVNSRWNGPRFAVTSTRIRRDVKLDTVRDADLTSVTCNVATHNWRASHRVQEVISVRCLSAITFHL
jgi:hypothetical protein